MMETPVPAGLSAALAHTRASEPVYTTRDALDIIADKRPQPEEVWGGLEFTAGQIMELIGASGLGKSRIVLNLAINQVLGKEFAGMKTYAKPLVWLFYGNENSFFRFRKDLVKMTSVLLPGERERLRGHIFLPTMEDPADTFVSFSDPQNVERLKATMRLRQPDVLVMDPWGAIIDGDELSDGDVRSTITTIQDVLRTNPDKPAVGIVLNHSRNGLKEEIDAAGANKANFGKNSKAIYSVVRCVWNLRRAELSDNPTKIELIHAKSSDIRPYPPVAIDFCQDSHQYRVDTTFSHAVWQATLEKAYHSGSTLTGEQRQVAKEDEDRKNCEMILNFLKSTKGGWAPRKALGEWLKEKGMGKNRIQEILSGMRDDGKIAVLCEKASNSRFICLPDAALKLLAESEPDAFRVVKPQGSSAATMANTIGQ